MGKLFSTVWKMCGILCCWNPSSRFIVPRVLISLFEIPVNLHITSVCRSNSSMQSTLQIDMSAPVSIRNFNSALLIWMVIEFVLELEILNIFNSAIPDERCFGHPSRNRFPGCLIQLH